MTSSATDRFVWAGLGVDVASHQTDPIDGSVFAVLSVDTRPIVRRWPHRMFTRDGEAAT